MVPLRIGHALDLLNRSAVNIATRVPFFKVYETDNYRKYINSILFIN